MGKLTIDKESQMMQFLSVAGYFCSYTSAASYIQERVRERERGGEGEGKGERERGRGRGGEGERERERDIPHARMVAIKLNA